MSGRGQPTKYKPEYCEQLVDYMAKGLPFRAFAGRIGVSRKTLHEWTNAHPEFAEAKAIGVEACFANWMEAMIQARAVRPGSAKIDTATAQMFCRNVFGWDRKDHDPDEDAPDPLTETQRKDLIVELSLVPEKKK